MFLVDSELKEALKAQILGISVEEDIFPPFDPSTQIGPSSIDLRLGRILRKYKQQVNEIDLTQKDETEIIEVHGDKDLIIQPGEFFIGVTVESITLPGNMMGIISIRSSIARLGLSAVEQIFMHPGHSQTVSLQLTNKTDRPIKIKPLIPICQIVLFRSTSFAEKGYRGKYYGESNIPLPSAIGVELGLEKKEQLVNHVETAKTQEFHKSHQGDTRSISLMNTVFLMVIAGCFPIIIQEFHVQPFPSPAFIISSILLLFCSACLVILHWRK